MSAEAGRRIGFKSHLHPVVLAGDATYLFSDAGVTALRGTHVEALAPLLDGTRGHAELLRDLPDEVPAEAAERLTRRLVDAGLAAWRPAAGTGTRRARAYWDLAGLDGGAAAERVRTGRVALVAVGTGDGATGKGTTGGVVTSGGVATTEHEAVLAATGLTVTDDVEDADLTVVLCDDYLDPAIAGIEARCRAAGRPWLLAKPGGASVWIGPVFRPGEPGCRSCLIHRLWTHRQAEAYVSGRLALAGPAPRPRPAAPGLEGLGTRLVALEAAKWLAGHRYDGQQSVWTLDTLDLTGRRHPFQARPQCEECGDPSLMSRQVSTPVLIRSAPTTPGDEGRLRSAEQVLESYAHLISPVTGVIREVSRDPYTPAAMHSFQAVAATGGLPTGLEELSAAALRRHGGRGVTAAQARASAVCEALERYSGCFVGDESTVHAPFTALDGEAIHPATIQLYDDRQYAGRALWNPAHSAFHHVCDPFDEKAPVDWTPVWSVTGGRFRLLPTGMLYYGAPRTTDRQFFMANSNGCAAGSSIEEAVLNGLYELIERDAVALWWHNRTAQPEVALDSFGDAWIDRLRHVHAGHGRRTWVLDVTADLGVPTMAAVSARTDRAAEDIIFGFGAHHDPHVALRRALTELNQIMPAVSEVTAGGSGYRFDDPDARRWWNHATVANQPYLRPSGAPARTRESYGYTNRRDLGADVEALAKTLDTAGLELLVLDQTRPDIGLPVVRVIVPGLRHFWARLGPGRLYDVPVRLGRIATATAYEDLNPMLMFL